MMRARNFKAEFWKSEDVSELSFMGRLLFLGLISLADRRGVLPYKPRRIKAEVFPYDDVKGDDVEACVKVMAARRMVTRYADAQEQEFLHLTNFEKHQSISTGEKRQSTLAGPLPTDEWCRIIEGSGLVGEKYPDPSGADEENDGLAVSGSCMGRASVVHGSCTKHLKSEIGNLKSEGGVGENIAGVADAPPAGGVDDPGSGEGEGDLADHADRTALPAVGKARVPAVWTTFSQAAAAVRVTLWPTFAVSPAIGGPEPPQVAVAFQFPLPDEV
jgi:hypothetical protein